jgi:hypothetical protein
MHSDHPERRRGKSTAGKMLAEAALEAGETVLQVERHAISLRRRVKRDGRSVDLIVPIRSEIDFAAMDENGYIPLCIVAAGTLVVGDDQ